MLLCELSRNRGNLTLKMLLVMCRQLLVRIEQVRFSVTVRKAVSLFKEMTRRSI